MMLRTRRLQLRLAAACVICLCAPSASAAEAVFEYSFKRKPIKALDVSAVFEPVDPKRCGADFGWIETVSGHFEAEALEYPVPSSYTLTTRRAGREYFSTRRDHVPKAKFPATMTAEYTGCVVPSGRVLVSFKMSVSIDTDEPKRFDVTYDGLPMPIGREIRGNEATNFKVETDLGDTIVSLVKFNSLPSFSYEPYTRFWITLRLQGRGITE